MPLTIDDVPDSFYGSYVRKHKNATEEEIINAYKDEQGSSKIAKPRDDVLDIAFTVPFNSNIDYIAELDRQLGSIRNSSEYFNYLAVVQSSGYGKTRAMHELAKLYPVIYLCFRSSVSTGYPKATTHSLILKNEIEFCDTMARVEAVANRWLAAMVITYLGKSHVYNPVKIKRKSIIIALE
ncbi:99_t:CDS:2 [Paraglomus occultum]|uniref:99_t:CDS:1 n=1 Tax=Paraglomus occultum TaxID=144539 RepID=A0A9N8ZBS8_9GLOM|nr:99_t:CDS:2 [Paraglomus occultum]